MMQFKLSDKEEKDAKEFREKHYKTCSHLLTTSTNGKAQFTYTFTPISIGNILKIKCNACGEELDITDIDTW